ncbi:MAG TPA: hypothetical protein VFG19_06780 [Geobacteraceae bacterium]|nr:hypothetical protein [Geobacteraceae bacterium]
MKKSALMFVVAVFVMSFGVCALAEESTYSEKTAAGKPSVTKEETVTAMATVTAIDLKNRLVTLEDEDGNTFDILVGEEARNLPQLKVGDVVEATYYESVAVKVYKPGEVPSVAGDTSMVAGAKKGEKPGGLAVKQATVTATVQSIDKKSQTAVLKRADGKIVTVKVKDPKNLENVNPGDEVVATYTRALAISVTKPEE